MFLGFRRRGNPEHNIALLSELESIGEQVHQDLLQALVVGDHYRIEVLAPLNEESEVLVLGQLMEAALQLSGDVVDENICDLDAHHARFDLRKIEDVVDE